MRNKNTVKKKENKNKWKVLKQVWVLHLIVQPLQWFCCKAEQVCCHWQRLCLWEDKTHQQWNKHNDLVLEWITTKGAHCIGMRNRCTNCNINISSSQSAKLKRQLQQSTYTASARQQGCCCCRRPTISSMLNSSDILKADAHTHTYVHSLARTYTTHTVNVLCTQGSTKQQTA